jgi:hypothetical protein
LRILRVEMKKQMIKLQAEFDAAMIELYRRARFEATYHSSHFLRMLSEHRGLKTAQILLRPQKESADFTALWERKRLDLTMEATIHDNPKWQGAGIGNLYHAAEEIQVSNRE